ncbi:N-acetyltransferase [Bacillaceae bacterium CLA-AA-H227]|uniref:N-acetyltransferase n=1 Tax=Robertmurraya yapensis (ex Hitch et al 2024) TaxID=3133160 RepID=A0ACC6S983_9BACI
MFKVRSSNDISEISMFISNLNSQPKHHIGYCGTDAAEIEHTLLNDFSDLAFDESFLCAYEGESLIGVLGLDYDKETAEAELWGPFISNDNWQVVANLLWDTLLKNFPFPLRKVYGFYNVESLAGKWFMDLQGAKFEGEHSIMTIPSKNISLNLPTSITIDEIHDDYIQEFKALHEQEFPNAYFSAEEIISRQSEEQKLFIAAAEQQFYGYIFCEVTPEFSEGDIHFLAVSPTARKMGVGTQLLKKCLEFFSSFETIKEITLSVKSDNQAALKVYLNAGFYEKHRLKFFSLDRQKTS